MPFSNCHLVFFSPNHFKTEIGFEYQPVIYGSHKIQILIYIIQATIELLRQTPPFRGKNVGLISVSTT